MSVDFVGREKESQEIIDALREGKNVILSGKYGIGRTSLVRHVAEKTTDRWRFLFVDFSRTPGEVCSDLLPELFRGQQFENARMGYHSKRFRIATLPLPDRRRHILVLDNVSKLSAQKGELLRCLTWEKRFQFVSIVESFLQPRDLFLLRAQMNPACQLTLRYLRVSDVAEFYRQFSRAHDLDWTESRIRNLTELTGGYPLRMKEIALRELGISPKG